MVETGPTLDVLCKPLLGAKKFAVHDVTLFISNDLPFSLKVVEA